MTQSNIDLDAFIRLLDGQADEDDNGSFYLDKAGIRAIAPGVSERQSIGLFSAEKEALRQFERDCRLSFPCTIQDVRQWVERTGEVDMPDGLTEPVEAAEAPEQVEVEPQIEAPPEDTQPEPTPTTEPPEPAKPPGPPATITDEVLDHYDQLRANGADWFNAAMDTIAIERFHLEGIKPDSIKRKSNDRKKRRRGQSGQSGQLEDS